MLLGDQGEDSAVFPEGGWWFNEQVPQQSPTDSHGFGIYHIHKGNYKRIFFTIDLFIVFKVGPRQANLVPIACASREGSPEPLLLARTSIESRGTFRQKTRSLAPLNG